MDDPSELSASVRDGVNALRARHGPPPLAHDMGAALAACKWALSMANWAGLAHSPWVQGANAPKPWLGGECVGMGYATAAAAVAGWADDPRHRAILLDPRYTRCGAAVAESDDGVKYWCLDLSD